MDELQTPIGASSLGPTAPVGKIKLIKKIVIGVIIAAIIGTGVLASRIWDPLWNPFRPSPEKVVERMLIKMKEVKASQQGVKIEYGVMIYEVESNKLKEKIYLFATFNFDLDTIDSKNPKSAAVFDIAIMQENTDSKINIAIAGEYRNVDKSSYFKLDTLDLPSEVEGLLIMFGIDKNKIRGQWIELSEQAMLGGEASEPETPKEQEKELQEKLMELFKEKKVYYVKEELPDQEVEGKGTYHYIFALDGKNIDEIMEELLELGLEFSGQSESGLVDMPESAVADFLEKIGGIDIEIWIGKKDYLLYKVKIEKEIDASQLEAGAKGKTSVKFEINFSNFNEPVEVEAPENFIKFEEIIFPPPLDIPQLPRETPTF